MTNRTALLSCAVFLLSVSTIDADESTPVQIPDSVAVTPLPSPPVPQPHPTPVATQHTESTHSKVEHLRMAADHLEAAGANELAQEIREEADALLAHSVERLDALRRQVAELQHEIAELEATTGCNQQVMLKCRIVEFDVAQMRQLGVDLSLFQGDESDQAGPILTNVNEGMVIAGFIKALQAQGMAKILAEPVIVTTNGRQATFRSGGEFPIPLPNDAMLNKVPYLSQLFVDTPAPSPDGPDEATIEYRSFGITIEAVPVVLGGGRLRLGLAPELATRDFENAVTINDTVVPGLNVRRVNTQVEMQFGETVTLVMGIPAAPQSIQQTGGETGPEAPETVTVICVTPEAVSPLPAN